MTVIAFGGAETPSSRLTLERLGVKRMSLSYYALTKKGMPKTKAYLISEHFSPDIDVWIESGATQAVKAGLTPQELNDFAADYESFIANNVDAIVGFTEFDAQPLGLETIKQNRQVYGSEPKLYPVWHSDYGMQELQAMAARYDNVAIPYATVESVSNLASVTRSLTATHGTVFHGLGIAKVENLRSIKFATVTTLSWTSPMRRGESIIYDGKSLVRYPKSMKAQARPRYKSVVEKAGLDFDDFLADKNQVATKLAIYSYLQLEASMNDKDRPDLRLIKGGKETLLSDTSDSDNSDLDGMLYSAPNNNAAIERKQEAAPVARRDPAEMTPMPVFGYQLKTIVEPGEDGIDTLKEVPVVSSSQASVRVCNTCFVAAVCPAFKENDQCAFNLPVEVKTQEQLKSLLTAIVEIQGQRVAFMRFAEELNGGYADPNVSQEIDRLFKLVKNVKELEENRDYIKITAERQSSGGVLSAIFGDRVTALREMEQPLTESQTTMIIKGSLEDK